jgi:glycosyltransferase involved in cell wall biosynthesis
VPDNGGLTVAVLGPASSVHVQRWTAMLTSIGYHVVVASWQPGPELADTELHVAPAVGASPVQRVPRAVVWLRRMIREVRPDIVHVHSLGVHGALALALPHGPAQVVTPWGSELRAARSSAARASVVRLATRRAGLVLPTSPSVAAEMIDRYAVPPARVRVFSWGVDEALIAARPSPGKVRASLGIPADATAVLSVRTASAVYRTLEIVSAFARAAAGRPDLFLVVLGGHRPDRESAQRAKDDYFDRVRDAASAIRDRCIVLTDPLTPKETFEVMCASDIAVSIPVGDQRSSSVLEAALAGCRLVLSDIAPYREMISDGLAADLLAEPVTSSLTEHLRGVTTDESVSRSNKQFILTKEHGAVKAGEIDLIYRTLVRNVPGSGAGRGDGVDGCGDRGEVVGGQGGVYRQ